MGTFYPRNDYRYLAHHGVKGQKWGVKNGPPYPIGSSPRKVFISGTSKIKLKDSEYYRKSLPKEITSKIDSYMKDNNHILIGDAPGIDTEVQKYLAKKGYRNVTVYTISEGKPRSYWDDGHLGWGIKNIKGTEQVDKDKAMSKDAHTGFAVILEDGAKATRNNIGRMEDMGKDVEVFQLNKDGNDSFINRNPVNLESNGWEIDKEAFGDNIFAGKQYGKNVRAWISAYKNTPNISTIIKNLDKINSNANRLRKEFAEVNYQNDKSQPIPEGYPKDFAEQNRKAFLEPRYTVFSYSDTRNNVPEYKKGRPDDLYEMSIWSPVDDYEYVLRISQDNKGNFYIDPNYEPEYR